MRWKVTFIFEKLFNIINLKYLWKIPLTDNIINLLVLRKNIVQSKINLKILCKKFAQSMCLIEGIEKQFHSLLRSETFYL